MKNLTSLFGQLAHDSLDNIFGFLTFDDLFNLRGSCRFFYNNVQIKNLLIDSLKKRIKQENENFQISCGNNHVLLKFDGYLYFTGPERQRKYWDPISLTMDWRPMTLEIISINNIAQLIFGWNHSLLLTKKSQIFSCGENTYGQLGINDYQDRDQPVEIHIQDILINDQIAQLEIGKGCYNFLLTKRGKLFGWGDNREGFLWSNNRQSVAVPTQIDLFQKNLEQGDKIVQIGIPDYDNSNLALTEHGQIFCWGRDKFQTLSLEIFQPKLEQGDKIIQIAVGADHNIALTKYGKVYAWGENYFGQLGLGHTNTSSCPIEIALSLKRDDKVKKIITQGKHSFIITNHGDVFAWGDNSAGQLGLGKKDKFFSSPTKVDLEALKLKDNENVENILVNNEYSILITNYARVFTCGVIPSCLNICDFSFEELILNRLQEFQTKLENLRKALESISSENTNQITNPVYAIKN